MTDRKHSKIIVRSDWTKAKYKIKKDWKLDVWRPTKKTPEVLKKLEEAYRVNCTDEEASAHAGIWLRTLNDWKEQDPEFSQQIQAWKKSYYFSIKNASFQRAQNIKNRDSTDILFKIDDSYKERKEIDVWETSLVAIAKAMQQKRLENEKWDKN